MKLRKFMSVLVSASLFVTSFGIAAAAVPETVQGKLAAIEQDTYGAEQTGAVLDRLSRLEKEYDGTHRSGSMMARVDALYDEIYNNGADPSLLAQLNAIEWSMGHKVSMKPVQARVAEMEMGIAGKTDEGTYRQRIGKLSKSAFGEVELPMVQTVVPASTLVKVALVTPVKSKNLKVGDVIKYQVAQDVVVDGLLVFAKGEQGEGVVAKVKQAKNFGRNAEVIVDFKKTKAIDGTYVDTHVGEEAKKEMKQLAMAAGASIAGIVLLGPVGIIGGAFVNGKNIDLPAGTEVYIQTKNEETLYGVQTTLAQ